MNAPSKDLEARLLAAVSAVAEELHPGRDGGPARLDSRLDRDLGFDSLGRLELLARVERAFGVVLPDRLAVAAETPRDLLRALTAAPDSAAAGAAATAVEPPRPASPRTLEAPVAAETWIDVLDWHAERQPDAGFIHFFQDDGDGEVVTFEALRHGARRVAAGLLARGLGTGEAVAIMLPTGRDYFEAFLGVLLAGAVPVPLYPPFRPGHIEEHVRRQAGILANCLAPIMIAPPEFMRIAPLLRGQVPSLKRVVAPADLVNGAAPPRPRVSGGQTALLQYTSGSTGAPKGVILSHANLLANVRALGRALAVGPGDVTVSWLPLYHDMGLIGAWLGSLYHGVPLVIMSPLAFVARPVRWLRAIHRHRGTVTAAPNFAFELCLRRVSDDDLAALDLSSLRAVCNGAEAISPAIMEAFIARFAACGFRREAMTPVYGLAESTVGLAFPPLGRGPVVDAIDRERLSRTGEAVPSAGKDAMRLVSCGMPLPRHEIRVVGRDGDELPERAEGRIEFRGPSATSGYFRDAEATRRLFRGDWRDTGDLGYLAGGEIHITGRAKDIIIKAGRNIYPEQIEQAVGAIDGIRKGGVAVFGAVEARDGAERLVVLAETRSASPERRRAIEQAATEAVLDVVGMPPDRLVLAPPNTVLKTSSGKIRRADMRRLFESGELLAGRRPPWRQVAALRLSALRGQAARLRRRLAADLFAALAWTGAAVAGVIGWTGVVLLPHASWRWRLVRAALRSLAAATGTPVAAKGLDRIPPGPVVYVANHASYLDGFVLAATLPAPLSFVAKAELDRRWTTALPLRRLGTAFVQRAETAHGIAGAGALAELAGSGRSLVVFAEGTFGRMPGLLPFHMGGFMAAAATGLPVVPVAIRGTRSMLRAGSWRPRRGMIAVAVGPALRPEPGDRWTEACRLRDQAREWMLRHTGEPDLATESADLPRAGS